MSGERLQGQCLCGAVRFSAVLGKPEVGVCHCSTCRRWGGGPFMVVETQGGLEFEAGSEADVSLFKASDWAERGFCAKCGSSLFYRLLANGLHFVNAAAFDDPGALTMTHEVFIDSKPDYYAFAGERRRMTEEEVFAAFNAAQGGADG